MNNRIILLQKVKSCDQVRSKSPVAAEPRSAVNFAEHFERGFFSRHEILALTLFHECLVWDLRDDLFRCVINICESYLEVLGV
jgi:hypothetical protein